MNTIPIIKLANGTTIPSIGFGTNSTESEKPGDVEAAVKTAIDVGYRYFHTSRLYGNELEVGSAIRSKVADGTIRRSDIFLVNLICCTIDRAEDVEEVCRESLKKLEIDYIDLYLLHLPHNYCYKGEDLLFPLYSEPKIQLNDVDYVRTWQSMERLTQELHLVKSIGLSNASIAQLRRILPPATIKPIICHIDCCPGFHQKKLIKFCNAEGIQVTAYCPLTRPDFKEFGEKYTGDPDIQQMCARYKKTSSQLILRYLYQLGAVPIPKSITESRIKQYIQIFDFELTAADVRKIDSFYKEERNIALEKALGHPLFPIKTSFTWKYSK